MNIVKLEKGPNQLCKVYTFSVEVTILDYFDISQFYICTYFQGGGGAKIILKDKAWLELRKENLLVRYTIPFYKNKVYKGGKTVHFKKFWASSQKFALFQKYYS